MPMRFRSLCPECGRRFGDERAENHQSPDGRCLNEKELAAAGTVRAADGIWRSTR